MKTTSMTITLRPDNVVEMVPSEGWDDIQTLSHAKENLAVVKELIDGQPRSLLVIVPTTYTNRDAIEYYQSAEVGDVARAMILNSFAAKVAGNLYLKFTKNKTNEAGRIVPAKIFTKREEAITWLLEEMNKHTN